MVRYKNRYLIVEIDDVEVKHKTGQLIPLDCTDDMLFSAVIKQVQTLHGDFGVGAVTTGLSLKYVNRYTKLALIRVRHGPHKFLETALNLITIINKRHVRFNTLHASGTVMQAYKFMRRHQLKKLEESWNTAKSQEEKVSLKRNFAIQAAASY